ncbi:MAG: 16S rRNA (cytidine(1402)-2'-O)-methyltransferase [Waddliaceae bacterium]|jgi:16S rRNA (cytidine1402-2'-O)-methyltransferase|nr:16S rRNA (cytidine(1402)-2'-O)-methyltransferase [Waddliaceae bacterium]MBT3579443.1 16S rRNA (cytidine(1402)-2'-O)-methyltransferase [Waddliaceae bacterium]MBT4445158.1 16S rRNA (cytidine(1402)-2'-O)-methyltransferase [Waddliaceae bacterium]MBT6928942.1 16S rRNA (cytidine(1402)-2'-O)-methyltransferase [Waddliaceae bacterium]MBT7264472.1 16S rRNA (cytidine(1402)-2'-O)-methyltransferase [Waddliaceae bacterium]
MLYLVSTPIGNLSDITFRAVEILKSCDYILCEDTRHSRNLLNHYDIGIPLKSFHAFNESSREDSILEDLRSGSDIALISDAGTPGISDPGERLVQRCHDEDLVVSPIPGASAVVAAVSSSGLATAPFQFFGFLPRKSSELKKALINILLYPGTTVCYESPHRLLATVDALAALSPSRMFTVCREMTKKFEEIRRDTAEGHKDYWRSATIKGEIAIVIAGNSEEKNSACQDLSPEEHVAIIEEEYSITRKEAIKIVAELRNVPKREIYNNINK